jgi:membrane-associated protease RseP (regulator of RpoE activity)
MLPATRPPLAPLRWRELRLPLILFLLTCGSTFIVGVLQWAPLSMLALAVESYQVSGDILLLRQLFLANWGQGLIFSVAVISILLAHEMGHYVATRIYRIPASLPIFLPCPISPIGTFGAVIGMQGNVANRKQIFDIGIAGPLAGLVIALPILWIGIERLDLSRPPGGGIAFEVPLLAKWIMAWLDKPELQPGQGIWLSQLNPYFTAGWVGFVITGLNMFPIGQLDGGHVTYTLFGKSAHWIARMTLVFAITSMVYFQSWTVVVMVVLLLLIGTDHPPTSDDRVPMGWARFGLGLVSLAIPVLCFPPFMMYYMPDYV